MNKYHGRMKMCFINMRNFWGHYVCMFFFMFSCIFSTSPSHVEASSLYAWRTNDIDHAEDLHQRKILFEHVSLLTGIPWNYLAAMDQYERSMQANRSLKQVESLQRIIAITIPENTWTGMLNPNPQDTDPYTISFYQGIGRDGSGDGVANRHDDLDVLATVIAVLHKHGKREEDLLIGLWDYYQNPRAVERIQQFAKIFTTYETLDLKQHTFPLSTKSSYAYQSTWGAKRGWGGRRIHEGSDIFARGGTPVGSTCFGVVEELGWNAYGGWRIGIRDLDNYYHYYAHLSGFDKQIKVGDVVKPGLTIGWVGSSGYGKPGTTGKFPPHLHYGLYRDRGQHDGSFDPYPLLKKWEREAKLAAPKNKLKK